MFNSVRFTHNCWNDMEKYFVIIQSNSLIYVAQLKNQSCTSTHCGTNLVRIIQKLVHELFFFRQSVLEDVLLLQARIRLFLGKMSLCEPSNIRKMKGKKSSIFMVGENDAQ